MLSWVGHFAHLRASASADPGHWQRLPVVLSDFTLSNQCVSIRVAQDPVKHVEGLHHTHEP